MRKFIAFTLAETLLVMGIIGVVAALTVPNLNQSTGNKEKVTKLKKVYSNLDDAYGRAIATYGPISRWFNNNSDNLPAGIIVADRIGEFLKVTKACENGETGCFGAGLYKAGAGNTVIGFDKAFLLADGTAISFSIQYEDCDGDFSVDGTGIATETCGLIDVDIDGPDGVNTYGVDTFSFQIAKRGIYPAGEQNTNEGDTQEVLARGCFTTGFSCAGWVINTGNMDYLKATKGTCPNGTELSWTNTTCK